MEEKQRIAALEISGVFLIDILKGLKDGAGRRFVIDKNPLPEDVEILGYAREEGEDRIKIFLKSESFEEVTKDKIPTLDPPWLKVVEDE